MILTAMSYLYKIKTRNENIVNLGLRICKVLLKQFLTRDIVNRHRRTIDLLNTNVAETISIDGIGKQSGFRSSSNFYTSFKEMTGYTPREWMKRNKNDA